MKGKLKALAALAAGLFLMALLVGGESAQLKERFLQRKPQLDQLKDQGWIGENSLGFLAFRGEAGKSKENKQLVQAENEDRGVVYAEIATKVNTSAIEVGKRRAIQIANLAAAGHWLQDAEGNWYQKQL
jgi:hypothetical protein